MTDLNWIISITLQYLEPFNCVQTNESSWKELLVLHSSTANYLTVYK